jgi:histidinol phosphatase-like enzyme (inositol monophosphatase family)
MAYREILDVAIDAAYEAGKITLEYFQTRSFEVETKADNSPVTMADKRSEERIVEIIRRSFPDHGIIGEESGTSRGSGAATWIVDPIDGTKSFICGVPFYGVMIGVEIDDEVVAGVVHFPALAETYYASKGGGSFWNGRRMRVSEVGAIESAVLLATDTKRFARDPGKARGHDRLVAAAKMYRSWGDCYGHMLVASGRAEIMLDPVMSVWDLAPLKVIVEEAGGVFTDWEGAATIHGTSAISTNSAIRDAVMEALAA